VNSARLVHSKGTSSETAEPFILQVVKRELDSMTVPKGSAVSPQRMGLSNPLLSWARQWIVPAAGIAAMLGLASLYAWAQPVYNAILYLIGVRAYATPFVDFEARLAGVSATCAGSTSISQIPAIRFCGWKTILRYGCILISCPKRIGQQRSAGRSDWCSSFRWRHCHCPKCGGGSQSCWRRRYRRGSPLRSSA